MAIIQRMLFYKSYEKEIEYSGYFVKSIGLTANRL
jgi:hypothetical protein